MKRACVKGVAPVLPKITALPLEGRRDFICISRCFGLFVAEEVHVIHLLNFEALFLRLAGLAACPGGRSSSESCLRKLLECQASHMNERDVTFQVSP